MISKLEKLKARWWDQYPPSVVYSLGSVDPELAASRNESLDIASRKQTLSLVKDIWKYIEELDLSTDMYSAPKMVESDGVKFLRSMYEDVYEFRCASYLKREHWNLHLNLLERMKSRIRKLYYNIYFFFHKDEYD